MHLQSDDRKILVLVFLLLVISASAISYLSFQTRDAMKDAVRNELRSVSISIGTQIDGDTLAGLERGDENTPEFFTIRDALYQAQEKNPDIRYIYTMRRVGDAVEFVVDAEYGYSAQAARIGERYQYPNAEMIKGFSEVSADEEFTTDQWGTVLSGYFPIRDHNGSVVGLVGVDMDRQTVVSRMNYINWGFYLLIIVAILLVALGVLWTEQVRTTGYHEIQESEERFRNLAESTRSGIFILQKQKFLYVNPATAAMIGYSPEEIASMDPAHLLHPDFREMLREGIINCMTGGESPTRYEVRILPKGGEERWAELNIGPILYQNSPAVICTITDITRMKMDEILIRESHKKLNLMTSITFHDIRNSLMKVFGFLELIQKKETDPQVLEYLGAIRSSADSIHAKIEAARIYQEIGHHPPVWQDVEPLLHAEARDLGAEGITVHVHLPGLAIMADPLFDHVFSTLFDNTIRHGKTATEVRVSMSRERENLILSFEDNGAGVAEQEKDRIFERGVGENTGYGLFLAREILAITGMSIRECGRAGNGARFEIQVPAGMFRVPEKETFT
ncbi:MAG: PAS domain S-box protein [Methanolinea sp.]|nr:PAS domain S-box protein [Methanolinea sp.]